MDSAAVGEVRAGAGSEYRAMVDPEQLRQMVLDLFKAKGSGRTFGELAAEWLGRISKRRVCPANEERHVRHMLRLANMREGDLTKAAIDNLFADLCAPRGPLCPSSINKLRSTGRLIIRDAQGNGLWGGLNPFDLVRRLRQPKRIYSTLTVAEVALVLPKLRPDRRRLSKTILLVGLRPGEAMGLRKVDVDLEARMLKVRRSHARNQTKTGKEREFPIPDDLVADLREAMAESPSELVFPKPDGTRMRADTKLARTLRTAMAAAGLVDGYRYHCRRKGCGRVDQSREMIDPYCPACGMRMLRVAIPRHIRFYDLRHSSASLHRKAKCDPLVIQEMLGHSPGNTTDSTYTHLDEDYCRKEVNKLKLEGAPEEQG